MNSLCIRYCRRIDLALVSFHGNEQYVDLRPESHDGRLRLSGECNVRLFVAGIWRKR